MSIVPSKNVPCSVQMLDSVPTATVMLKLSDVYVTVDTMDQ